MTHDWCVGVLGVGPFLVLLFTCFLLATFISLFWRRQSRPFSKFKGTCPSRLPWQFWKRIYCGDELEQRNCLEAKIYGDELFFCYYRDNRSMANYLLSAWMSSFPQKKVVTLAAGFSKSFFQYRFENAFFWLSKSGLLVNLLFRWYRRWRLEIFSVLGEAIGG